MSGQSGFDIEDAEKLRLRLRSFSDQIAGEWRDVMSIWNDLENVWDDTQYLNFRSYFIELSKAQEHTLHQINDFERFLNEKIFEVLDVAQLVNITSSLFTSYIGRYRRPTTFRKGVRDQVWDKAKDSYGRVKDNVTGLFMSREKPWDMGHKEGYEFRKHQLSAMLRGISREQFLNEYNNPDHYRPELPSSNRSHKGEDMTDQYFGD